MIICSYKRSERYGFSVGEWQTNKAFYSVSINQFQRTILDVNTKQQVKKVVYKVSINAQNRKHDIKPLEEIYP